MIYQKLTANIYYLKNNLTFITSLCLNFKKEISPNVTIEDKIIQKEYFKKMVINNVSTASKDLTQQNLYKKFEYVTILEN